MNKSYYAVLFILALGVAYAAPQTPAQNQRTQSTTQASQAGPAAQSDNAGQTGSAGPAQSTSPATVPGGTRSASGGAVTGSAAVNTGKVPVTENPQSTATTASDSELQNLIQQALSKEPTLAGDAVNVAVSGRSIELSGRVGNARQKLTATRIVESYAANKKVVDHLTIGNTSGNAAAASPGETGNEANPPGRPDLSSHPEPEKGSSPGTSTRPPQ